MKTKHWIIVGVIAVLCVGAAVLLNNKTSEERVPANAGVASSVPAATEEPTPTEEPVENIAHNDAEGSEVKETAPVAEEPEEKEPALQLSDEELIAAYMDKEIQYWMNERGYSYDDAYDMGIEGQKILKRYMEEENCSLEEALTWDAEMDQKFEAERKQREEHIAHQQAAIKAKGYASDAKRNQMCLDETGMTVEEFYSKDGKLAKGVQWCVDHQKHPDFMSYTGDDFPSLEEIYQMSSEELDALIQKCNKIVKDIEDTYGIVIGD